MSYDLLFRQAIEFHQNGDYDHAEQLYRQILEAIPNQADVLNLLGLIAQIKNIHQEAVSLFYRAIQADNKRAQFYFNLGISLRLWNKPYEALEAFEKSATLEPNTKETWLEIGNLKKDLNQPENANHAYNKALNIDPQYTDAKINQILLTHSEDQAITQLHELHHQSPNTPQINYHLGLLYFKQNKFENSLTYLRQAVEFCPHNEEANSLLGQSLLALNNIAEAKESFLHTLEIASNNLPALINLGNIETSAQNYPLAEKYYRRAIELDNQNFDAHHNYATMLYHQHRTSEALEEYRQALIINPQSAESCNNLGLILRDEKDFDEALGLFFNALSLKPQQEEISVNIAETLILKHRTSPQDALKIAQNWLSQYPQNIFAQHTVASLSGNNRPDNNTYAQKLFDNFAPNYEKTLQTLEYQLPQQIHTILAPLNGNILDLGCGTGLTAQAIKSNHNNIYGVDISSQMLKLAKNKNIYQELYCQDIISYLSQKQTSFDFIIAADVFCYFSDLEAIIKHCYPTPICFSIEVSEDIKNYQITPNGRYKHSSSYIKQLLNKYNYNYVEEHPLFLRNENDQPVEGIIFVARP